MTTAAQTLAWPLEVSDFAAEQGVADCLPALLELTNQVFPDGLQSVIVEDDPEIADDRHIVFLVKAQNLDVDRGLAAIEQWQRGVFLSCPKPLVCVFRLGLSIAP